MKDENPITGYNLSSYQKRKRKVSNSDEDVVKTDTQGISSHPLRYLRFNGSSRHNQSYEQTWNMKINVFQNALNIIIMIVIYVKLI